MNEPETTETDYECPRGCENTLVYGKFADARKGIRGYSCEECGYIWTTGDLKRRGVIPDE